MNYLDLSTPLPTAPLQFRAIQYAAPEPGFKLLITGAVHGNETCGTRGILQVLQEFESGQLQLIKGSVTFVPITNPLAYQKRQRSGDRNLNRNLGPTDSPIEFEDRIANWLCPLMAQHDGLLDLHSFHTGGQAFAMVGPRNNNGSLEPFQHDAAEEAMALRLGVTRFVDGWLDTYARGVARRVAEYGTGGDRKNVINTDPRYGVGTTEYMRSRRGLAITLECGQHDDAQSPHVAYTAIKNTIANFGLIDLPRPEPVVRREMLSLYEVIDKTNPADAFNKAWASFDAVKKGEQIGTRANGDPIVSSEDGYIVFPNPKAESGQEWFYLAKRTDRLVKSV
jgi:uncharacterized protein